jgi:type IV secretion system protein VirB10
MADKDPGQPSPPQQFDADQDGLAKPTLRARRRLSSKAKIGIAALALSGVGAVTYPFLRSDGITTAVDTSDSDEFQSADAGSGIGRIELESDPAPDKKPDFDPSPLESELERQRRELEERNARTLAEMDDLKAQMAKLAARRPDDSAAALSEGLAAMQAEMESLLDGNREALELQLSEAETAAAKRASELVAANKAAQDKLEAQIAGVQRENDALQEQINGGLNDMAAAQAERDRLAMEEADRQAMLDKRQLEQRKLREAQIKSKAVVFDNGGTKSGNGGGDGATSQSDVASAGASSLGPAEPLSPDDKARSFVMAGAKPVEVTSAEVIANPSDTILQGTIIEATLETAIDSQLPGQISATVNYPVWSFDQSRILIPAGSRLFGTYDSDVSLGQSRVLVGWTRLVTPDGQSVELAAFGADDQGRSGMTGKVNSRFGLRFGSAALLSIIGATPSIAAASVDSAIGANVAEEMGDNFSETTDSVVGEYAVLPPIISVQPGAALTVIVDRDLEFF